MDGGWPRFQFRCRQVGAAFAKELAKMTGLKEVQCVLGPRSGQLEGTAVRRGRGWGRACLIAACAW